MKADATMKTPSDFESLFDYETYLLTEVRASAARDRRLAQVKEARRRFGDHAVALVRGSEDLFHVTNIPEEQFVHATLPERYRGKEGAR
jgi:hypothetical protein